MPSETSASQKSPKLFEAAKKLAASKAKLERWKKAHQTLEKIAATVGKK